ncbi:unnamed protein product [Cuscuta epithymum]|uniref:Uncharacterized protein n=1 Tax=Cuscuta epithymum TaxID=186058 RepID=A0AAV0DG01_9ASTE|nr:unnamed protein product [Cuscuta epithymum]
MAMSNSCSSYFNLYHLPSSVTHKVSTLFPNVDQNFQAHHLQ